MSLKKSRNRKQPMWLHEYRELILKMEYEQFSLQKIAEKIQEESGKKTSRQHIHYYLKNYPAEPETEQVIKPVTTEKKTVPDVEAKHAADDVFSSIEKSRENQFIEKNPEPTNTTQNPFMGLGKKFGADKPNIDPDAEKWL